MLNRIAIAALPALVLIGGTAVAQATPREQLAQATPTASPAASPAAGVIPLGVTIVEMRAIVTGWSAKKDILGKHVRNDRNEDLGRIEDLIITPKDEASFAIVGVGGFLGIAARLVAIPTKQLAVEGDHFKLPGATKDALKAMPPFIYAH
jgi:hypothetical protein